MGKGRKRGREKTTDKWKTKQWFVVEAPKIFENKEIAVAPAQQIEEILGRTFVTTLFDLTGNYKFMHLKLFFRAQEIKAGKIQTKYIGHDIARDYLRSLVRRSTTRIDGILNLKTKDGYLLRIFALMFTQRRIKRSQQDAIRAIMFDQIKLAAEQFNFDEFINEAVSGKMAEVLLDQCKLVVPIRSAEIMKIKVVQDPTIIAA
ncbi:MAG: 30S ribosomal protein S3ae [Candidatus Lokiarchaeota archaeon]|nr:30S ribosomal protein S3ae [Candidatus Lokiarchaeota archaeon]